MKVNRIHWQYGRGIRKRSHLHYIKDENIMLPTRIASRRRTLIWSSYLIYRVTKLFARIENKIMRPAADEVPSPKWIESNTQNKTELIHWDSMKWGAERSLWYAHTHTYPRSRMKIKQMELSPTPIYGNHLLDTGTHQHAHTNTHTWWAILCCSHSCWPNE